MVVAREISEQKGRCRDNSAISIVQNVITVKIAARSGMRQRFCERPSNQVGSIIKQPSVSKKGNSNKLAFDGVVLHDSREKLA